MIRVNFTNPANGVTLAADLPRSTKFSAMSGLLYETGFLAPQKGGYGFLINGNLCGASHRLGDYLDDDALSADVTVFDIPKIMV